MGTEDNVLSFLRLEPIFGDLVNNEHFTALYSEMVGALYDDPNIARLMEKILTSN